MAYVTQERNRAATIAAVGALHAAAIYALVTGLAGPMWEKITHPPIVGEQIPLPKVTPDKPDKPVPERTRIPERAQRDRTTGDTVITTTTTSVIKDDGEIFPPSSGGTGEGGGTIIEKPIPQTAGPVFTPKLAKPIGRPGLWVTPNDYPANALRQRHEGVTRFQLGIGTDGKVLSCEVTVSSGHAALDEAACANLRKRARFVAATGPDGAAVPGTYSSAVRWKLPADY